MKRREKLVIFVLGFISGLLIIELFRVFLF